MSVELVRAARDGDRKAFAELHRRYVRLVRRLLMARWGTRDLEDRVQNVFAIALDRLGQLRDAEAFGSWLAQIARRDALGRREPIADGVLVDELPIEDGPRVEAERVLEKIRALPSALAEPLVLRLVFGMTSPEIARELHLSPGYVRVALHRGMTQLRGIIAIAVCLLAVAAAYHLRPRPQPAAEARPDPSTVAPIAPETAPAPEAPPAPAPEAAPAAAPSARPKPPPKDPWKGIPTTKPRPRGKLLDPFAKQPAKKK